MAIEATKALIRRYYNELWNPWNFDLADELIAQQIAFRGSLGMKADGREGFKEYMRTVQRAFPDFHNKIEELIAEDDKVVARLTYSGTHRGELFGIAPTGHRVGYCGIAIFHVSEGSVAEGYVLGDTRALMQQLEG